MIVAVGSGVLAAVGLRRYVFHGRELLRQTFLLPIVFPQIVIGVGLLLWFSAIRGFPMWLRLLIGYLVLALPYVIVTTSASLESVDERLEEAAMNLGANRLRTFWYVTLPLIQSGIVSGALFAWLVSFSNFTVSFFLYSGEVRPLPVWVFEVLQFAIDPTVAALSTCLVLVTLIAGVVLNQLVGLGRLVGLRR
jgi:putative spermidine/putrescine transport system permease protein